jgi:RimJ/RimL family protein N-acetyltransferase
MPDDVVMIQGKRLLLRPIQTPEIDEECREMAKAAPSASVVLSSETGFRDRLTRSGRMLGGWLDLAIDLDGKMIGRIQTLVPAERTLPPGTFEIGIGLREAARGKGYGREALRLFTDWLFENAGAQVLEAGTDEGNHAMRSVFGHVGWREDGTLAESGQEWILYRITRAEWKNRKRQNQPNA